ncbi:hypothetical protein [Nakamurella lactea]|uniref:hypothetical protein n=1 Tax=Nakamurella lactea TaxID=459515 RepID=UPI000687C6E2|nr:hypothetical protein [Nakamurella lactea]
MRAFFAATILRTCRAIAMSPWPWNVSATAELPVGPVATWVAEPSGLTAVVVAADERAPADAREGSEADRDPDEDAVLEDESAPEGLGVATLAGLVPAAPDDVGVELFAVIPTGPADGGTGGGDPDRSPVVQPTTPDAAAARPDTISARREKLCMAPRYLNYYLTSSR